MLLNTTQYSSYIDGDVVQHIQEQRSSDGRVTSWATEACNACIHVFKKENGIQTRLVFEPLSHSSVSRHILLNLENEHFNSF